VFQPLLRSGVIQAKLTVSQPGDPLEQEADQVADEVMRMPADPPSLSAADPEIQRKCSCGGKEDETKLQAKEAPQIQRTPRAKHDLTSPRFSRLPALEAIYDGKVVLDKGATGAGVQAVQHALYDLGFKLSLHGADGIFGSETAGAVKAFQLKNEHLPVTSKVDKGTMTALDAAFGPVTLPDKTARSGQWTQPCVLSILCPWSPHTIDVLNKVGVELVDSISSLEERWDGTSWIQQTSQAKGSFSGVIQARNDLSCEVMAQTLYHEALHAEQPGFHITTVEKESYAHRIGEEFNISMGLEGKPSLRSTDPQGRSFASPTKIGSMLRGSYSGTSEIRSDEEVVGKTADGKVKVERRGKLETRKPQIGDTITIAELPSKKEGVVTNWECSKGSPTGDSSSAHPQSTQPVIQRKCSCSPDSGHVCDKCAKEGEKKLQAKEAPGRTPSVTPQVESHIESLRAGGQPLPGSVRSFFEPRFGRDLGGVRVHSDARANEAASAVQARAFALGNNVVFGPGEYAPQSYEGQRLLAHELAHTIQQTKETPTVSNCLLQRKASDDSQSEVWGGAAPVALSLKRKDHGMKGDVTFSEKEEAPVVGSREMGEVRALLIRSRVDQIKQAAETRLLKIRDYAESAIKDFEKSSETTPDKISSFYTSTLPATLIPAAVQIIRVAALGSPYPKGFRKPLARIGTLREGPQGGLLHMAATVTGATVQLSVIAFLLSLNMTAEEEAAEVAKKSASLVEGVDHTLSTRTEVVREKLPQALEAHFQNDPQAFQLLQDASLSAEDLLDRFGFPRVNVQSVYVPLLKQLEESFTRWLVQNKKSQLLPGLVRGLSPAEEFNEERAARRRTTEATNQRFGGPESQMQSFRKKSLTELLEP
jgi:Domain of unknown function (DUF4157)/Putative peptidoglycan binding domain